MDAFTISNDEVDLLAADVALGLDRFCEVEPVREPGVQVLGRERAPVAERRTSGLEYVCGDNDQPGPSDLSAVSKVAIHLDEDFLRFDETIHVVRGRDRIEYDWQHDQDCPGH